ncbi:hypothetical protein BGZ72_009244 [Mortierella alpina]|nr:hypothetical protein BGZ72_009244 [Mortierella alpina]
MELPTPLPLPLPESSHPYSALAHPTRAETDSCSILPTSTNTSSSNLSPSHTPASPAAPSSRGKTLSPSSESAPSLPPPPSPTLSNSHLSVNNLQRAPDTASLYGAQTASILSRHSSRPASLQHVGATAAALIHNAEARRLRVNLYRELVGGWYHLSTSSKVLLAYYIGATMVEIVATVTMGIIERKTAQKCYLLAIFLGLYLVRSVIICGLLLRRFLFVRPDDLPRDLSGACGAHYKTMINWASLILLMISVAMVTTQSHCAEDSPGLFYLVLVFSLVGYVCLAMLLILWLVILFCLNGLVIVLELFGVGPTVMQWQGATPEMLNNIPIVKYSRPEPEPNSTPPRQQHSAQSPIEKRESPLVPPSIIVSDEHVSGPGVQAPDSMDVVINMDLTNPLAKDAEAAGSCVLTAESEKSDSVVAERGQPQASLETPGTMKMLQGFDDSKEQEEEEQEHETDKDRMLPSCSICLCDYEDMEELRHLPCDHYFHKECVDEWLKLKRTCPLCKYDISQARRGRRFWPRRGSQGRDNGSGNRTRTRRSLPFFSARRA